MTLQEVRFRDIITDPSNQEIFNRKIGQIIGKPDLKLLLISNELPLVRDVIGLQIRKSDIVAFDENNNLYLIELKIRINESGKVKVVDQITEYLELLKQIIKFVIEKPVLYFYHHLLKRYFEFMQIDISSIKNIIPVILSLKELNSEDFKIKAGFLNDDEIRQIKQNFIHSKIERFNTNYKNLFKNPDDFVKKLADKLFEFGNSWFPLVLTRKLTQNGDRNLEVDCENITNFKKRQIRILKNENLDLIEKIPYSIVCQNKDGINADTSIPEVFKLIRPKNLPEILIKAFQQMTDPQFIIQIFRSGRTDPIIYFQIDTDSYVPLRQIKPVVYRIERSVNSSIANDATETFSSEKTATISKKLHYSRVILFDRGIYEVSSEVSEGVRFTSVKLRGKRYTIDFKLLYPKLKSSANLLPYMHHNKVKNHISNLMINKQDGYLYEDQWISTPIHIKPNN